MRCDEPDCVDCRLAEWTVAVLHAGGAPVVRAYVQGVLDRVLASCRAPLPAWYVRRVEQLEAGTRAGPPTEADGPV